MSLIRNHILLTKNFLAFYGITSKPTDLGGNVATGTNGLNPIASPPTGMKSGDLVVVFIEARTSGRTCTILDAGGQSWTFNTSGEGGNTPQLFLAWCTFNGTWSATPVFQILGSSAPCQSQMLVFRPNKGTVWAFDQATSYVSSSSSASNTMTGVTNTKRENVTIGLFFVQNTETFSSISGAGWNIIGSQIRHSNSIGGTIIIAYQLQGYKPGGMLVGATGNCTITISNAQAWRTLIQSFSCT